MKDIPALPPTPGPLAELDREAFGQSHRMLPEVRIVLIYFILAGAWIVISDRYLTAVSTSEKQLEVFQSLKGLNFVLTTAILLYLVLRRAYGGWRKAERERLAVIAESGERFRRLSSRIQSLREEERTRISREIHDELGQYLTSLKMELRLLERRIADRDDRGLNFAIDKLVESAELVDTTIASVQRISAGLRPAALDDLGLGTALLEEAERFSQRTGIQCVMTLGNVAAELPEEVTTTAFRIFQESLTNVARHSGARRVEATLGIEGGVLRLTIHDDGRGIDARAAEDPRALGLIGMLERAGHVGGHVCFRPGRDGGTDVILTVPLRREESSVT